MPPTELRAYPTLSENLGSAEEIAIVQCFWKENLLATDLDLYKPYLDFYRSEMRSLRFGLLEESHLLARMAAQSHSDLRRIVEILSDCRNEKLSTTRAAIQTVFPNHDGEAIGISINLAVRVWLTLNTRERSGSLMVGSAPILPWDDDSMRLVDFVDRQFPSTTPTLPPPESWLDPQLTAYNLDRNCQVVVEWTNCLADHLRFDPERRQLHVYPFKICLHDHAKASGTSLSAVRPPG